jgi:hypothetical protein
MVSGGMIYIASFMKTGTGIQAILRFCLRNLIGFNAVITKGSYLRTRPRDRVRFHDIRTKFHKDWFRY